MITKLNIRFIEENETYNKGIVFCSSNFKELMSCPLGLIEDALNDAGYFLDDDDYSIYDLEEIQAVIDDFGKVECKVGKITNKHFWFDEKK